jgi:hypothetical protein
MADVHHVSNGTSHEGLTKPVTYSDVFGASGKIGEEAVTNEDAALMQSAETVTLGKTQKGGAASAMQAAAQLNVSEGLVDKDAHSSVGPAHLTGVQIELMLVYQIRWTRLSWRKCSDGLFTNCNNYMRHFLCLVLTSRLFRGLWSLLNGEGRGSW